MGKWFPPPERCLRYFEPTQPTPETVLQPAKVAEKLRAQTPQFAGIISLHFSNPQARFIEPMLLGIAARQDCKLSRIARALGEPIVLKKAEERLSRHLAAPQLGQQVPARLVAQAARRIGFRDAPGH